MKDIIKKIGGLFPVINAERGELSFFSLALREDAFVWDLLVAGKWIDDDQRSSLAYLTEKVQSVLTKQELLKISAIILLRHEYYTQGNILKSDLGWEESDIDLYGIAVQKAYIFVAPDIEFKMSPMYVNQ